MLKSIKIKNFHSIGEEQEMSFAISGKDVLDDSARIITDDLALNVASCIVGANASGKTNALKALTFLFWLVDSAYSSEKPDASIPISSHKLRENEPSCIEVVFCNSGKTYHYSIELNRKGVLKESLSKKVKRMINVFTLTRRDGETTVVTHGLKINDADMKRFKARQNVPLLSSLIDTGYLPEITFFSNFQSNVGRYGSSHLNHMAISWGASQALHADVNLREDVLSFIKSIDVGISDFQFREVATPRKGADSDEKTQILQGIHNFNGPGFKLDIFNESNGTQISVAMLSELLPILQTGGVAVLDEIEAGMHPYVIKKIISLFEDKVTNPKNAQLIFSTHQHLLLRDRTKTQIFIAERDNENFETELFRLDEIEGIRNDENYFNKYIAGAYGGTPRIDWL